MRSRITMIAAATVWACAAGLVIALCWRTSDGPQLGNDGYQYLSVADNLLDGNGPSTSIIHFDEQQYLGTLPAPQTVFPPGYSVLVAAARWTGLSPVIAGASVSIGAIILLVFIFVIIAYRLRFGPWVRRALTGALILNVATPLYAISIGSGALFAVVYLLAVACLIRGEDAESGPRLSYIMAAAIFLGIGLLVRSPSPSVARGSEYSAPATRHAHMTLATG